MTLLSAATVGAYLAERGLVDAAVPLECSELGGGVSSVVLDVRSPGRRLVVKQPLGRFRVDEEWVVKRERVLVEAAALEIAARVLPDATPALIDVDRHELVIVIAGAPADWSSWKQRLLDGDADEGVAARAGALLATWHELTREPSLLDRFDDPEIFGQQRVDPYYRTTMQRHPHLAGEMQALLDRLLATRTCLVHGDFSPKNVLTGAGGEWVIDWEITHAGDPAFDVAFMTNHLMLKAFHRPAAGGRYERCARAFWSAYGDVSDPPYVLGHVGCLMLARTDGLSPAEYLTGAERDTARRLGSSLVADPPATLVAAWARVSG